MTSYQNAIGQTVIVEQGTDFEVSGIPFRFYSNALWIDGGDRDDYRIRGIEDDAQQVEITITKRDVEKYEFCVANGMFDEDEDDEF